MLLTTRDVFVMFLFVQVIRAWYLVGKIGGYNSTNLQVRVSIEQLVSVFVYVFSRPPFTRWAESALPSCFHSIIE